MDDASTLRRKAARYFDDAASTATSAEAEKLREVGRQLELWADDVEERHDAGKNPARDKARER